MLLIRCQEIQGRDFIIVTVLALHRLTPKEPLSLWWETLMANSTTSATCGCWSVENGAQPQECHRGWKVHSRVCISACDHVFSSLGPFSTIHCHRFKVAGYPSPASLFIFNGDFVDRGSWGLETLLLLLAWKLAAPQHVHLLRGNHETALCTMVYGFKGELVAKLGRGKWKVRGSLKCAAFLFKTTFSRSKGSSAS